MIGSYPVASLLLDEGNPRFASALDSQRAAINAILTSAPSKLHRLAEDIARQGGVNPTELPVVVEEAGEFIVIEGNRRLAAIKLLRNPALADDGEQQAQFRAIAQDGIVPDEIQCYRAETREKAMHWLELRHTGENDGVGVVPWEAWQTNNFRRKRGTQADRASLLCAAVGDAFPDDHELLQLIDDVRRNRLTTLGRLVSDPSVRLEFGFDFEDDRVVFHYDHSYMLGVFRVIFEDIAGTTGVSQIKSKTQREDYIRSRTDVLPPRAMRLDAPRSPKDLHPPALKLTTHTGTVPRRSVPKEERHIFQGLTLRTIDLRTSKLLNQAQTIEIELLPGVAAVLVRVVVELVVTEFLTRVDSNTDEGATLKRKIGAAILLLDPDAKTTRRDKALEPAWIRNQEDTGIIVQAMNAYVHSVMANPTAAEVRELSRTFRPLLEKVDSHLANTIA